MHELIPAFRKFSYSRAMNELVQSLGYKHPAIVQSMCVGLPWSWVLSVCFGFQVHFQAAAHWCARGRAPGQHVPLHEAAISGALPTFLSLCLQSADPVLTV